MSIFYIENVNNIYIDNLKISNIIFTDIFKFLYSVNISISNVIINNGTIAVI